MEYLGVEYPDLFQSLSTTHRSRHEISKMEKRTSLMLTEFTVRLDFSCLLPLKFLRARGLRTKLLFNVMYNTTFYFSLDFFCPIFLYDIHEAYIMEKSFDTSGKWDIL